MHRTFLFVKGVWSKCAVAKPKHMFGATGRLRGCGEIRREWGKNNYCVRRFEAKSVDPVSCVATLKRESPCSSAENAAGRRWIYSFPRQAGNGLPSRKVPDRHYALKVCRGRSSPTRGCRVTRPPRSERSLALCQYKSCSAGFSSPVHY